MRNESLEQNLNQSRLETCGSPMPDLARFFIKEFILKFKVFLVLLPKLLGNRIGVCEVCYWISHLPAKMRPLGGS